MKGSIRIWQEQPRALKHYFESKITRQLLSKSAMFSWLVVWAAEVMNKFNLQEDGRTVYKAITHYQDEAD